MLEFALLLLFVAAVWFLWDSLKAREAANAAMRAACRANGLLFLDDTVALASLRPVRDGAGHACLRRVYRFEFSETGNNRRKGSIVMTRDRAGAIELDLSPPPPEFTVH